ncbi:hypothetical protein YT1_0248 [Rhodococcus ruber]|nr:hypothetical protein YT1_0248 [Rhodococcus ruber]
MIRPPGGPIRKASRGPTVVACAGDAPPRTAHDAESVLDANVRGNQ